MRVVDRGHDDQDAVGALGARLRHLIGVEHEILAQHRQRGRRARRRHEIRLALERRRVGEHRQAGRAAGLIGARQRRRIEIGADQALGGARLLDLGDQRVVAGSRARARCAPTKPRGAGAALASASIVGQRARRAWPRRSPRACRPRSWLRISDIALTRSETAIRRSSRPSASPLSSDFCRQRDALP